MTLWALVACALARDVSPSSPDALYARVSPAVVGIESQSGQGAALEGFTEYGTGVIIHPSGLALTSITVAPPGARRIRVHFPAGRSSEAEVLRAFPEMELVLLKLRQPSGGSGEPFPFLPLGDSSRLRVGQLAYALGNAFRSISDDHQVSFAAGAISGGYVLTEARNQSLYRGPAIETTAAVNDGMQGGPLVNSRGEVVAILSLNFSRSRWLGTGIPVNVLKPLIAGEVGWFSDHLERFQAYLGLELWPPELSPRRAGEPGDGPGRLDRRPVVARVDPDGPAARAGLKEGDRIASWQGSPLADTMEFRLRFMTLRPGDRLKLGTERGGERREVEATLWGSY